MLGHFDISTNFYDLLKHSIDVASCTLCFLLGMFVALNVKE